MSLKVKMQLLKQELAQEELRMKQATKLHKVMKVKAVPGIFTS